MNRPVSDPAKSKWKLDFWGRPGHIGAYIIVCDGFGTIAEFDPSLGQLVPENVVRSHNRSIASRPTKNGGKKKKKTKRR